MLRAKSGYLTIHLEWQLKEEDPDQIPVKIR